jgi:putative hemolysin
VILLICSAFFSGTETAYLSLDRTQQRRLGKTPSGARAVALLSNPGLLLSALLLGNTLVNVTASALAASISAELFPGDGDLSLGLAVVIMTFVLLIFSEISPKILAASMAERWASRVSRVLTEYVRFSAPLASTLSRFVGAVLHAAGVRPPGDHLSPEEVVTLVELGRSEGILGKEAAATLSLLRLEESQCVQVMRPRSEVAVVRTGWSRERFEKVIEGTGFTRYPLLDGTVEKVVGYIDSREFLTTPHDTPLAVRRLPSFPENASLEIVLKGLRDSGVEAGAVFDEYGDWMGMVTIRDIISYVLHSPVTDSGVLPEGVVISGGGMVVPGSMKLEVLSALMEQEIEARWAETCAGLLEEITGRIPVEGEEIEAFALVFRVIERVDRRLVRLQVRRKPEALP